MLATARALFCIFLFLVEITVGSPLQSRATYCVKDYHRVPYKWTKIGSPSADHTIILTISLKQGRFAELEKHLIEASDPNHPHYGHYLMKAEVDEFVKPTEEALDLVHEWLADHGIDQDIEYSSSKDTIAFALPVKDVEDLLDTEYAIYEHVDGTRLVRTTSYSLPAHLHEHIAIITPTNQFLRADPRGKQARPVKGGSDAALTFPPAPSVASIDAVCNFSLITPTCLRTIYGTINYTAQVPGKNKVSLNDFLGEINLRTDVGQFLELFRPDAVAGASEFVQVSINGGTVQQTPLNETELEDETGIEGELDAETILGISYPTPLTIYSTGGLNPTFMPDNQTTTNSDEPYLTWVNYVLGTEDIPQVVSTSYGDDEQTVSKLYAIEVCNKFAQFGARGITLLYASGDYGVGADGTCYSNDGLGTYEFLPSFPNDCPFVTNVGATTGYPEVAANDTRFEIPFTSGAGFSNYFAMPYWQKKAVKAYITGLDGEFDGLYNKSGRAYPDIAALGQIFATVWNGSVIQVDGTSASTPAAAGVLTLVNDALIAAGKPTLGFMNPWLYAYGHKAFTDVVSGSSAGCNTTGFPAKVGWDAVTGWGTPYFPDILDILGVGEGKGWKKE